MERRMSPKGSRTVWSGGKDEDNIKVLPIAINSYRSNDICFCTYTGIRIITTEIWSKGADI